MNVIKSLSVIVPVSERGERLLEVLDGYYENVAKLDLDFEIVVVLTPEYESLTGALIAKNKEIGCLKIISLNRSYGEAGLLKIGIDSSKYDHILTLPPYEQVSPGAIGEILNALDDNDAVVVNRSPRLDNKVNRIQSFVFKALLKLLAYNVPKDPGCGIWLAKKEVFEEVKLYGDLHRFFFMLACQLGFRVEELDIPQSKADTQRRVYSVRTYLSRLLDILTIAFLSRFHQKPLRFFGAGGAISVLIGSLGLVYIGIERIFFNVPVADRPLLVLFSLFLVLGVQLIAIGLVGETIIFTSAKNNKEYRIRKIIN